MRTIAVINQKGGCGKTTTTINLAACLAQKNKRVLVVDMDPQAHATLGLGITPGGYPYSVYDLLVDNDQDAMLIDDVIIPVTQKMYLLPSDVMLSAAEPMLHGRKEREYQLADILAPVTEHYEYIIIDCPPNIGILTFNALFACTEALIPMETGLFAMHGLAKLLETIHLVNSKRDQKIMVNALLTMFDRRTKISHETLNEIGKHLGDQVFSTIINFNVRLKEAASHGKPIISYAPDSAGAKDYLALAQEVMRMKVKKQTPVRLSDARDADEGVTFSFYAPEAKKVYVVADFNDWNIGRTPLRRSDSSGVWKGVVPLGKGRYEYKFYVDGKWVTDPSNPRTEKNEFGENSFIEIH